MCSLYEGQPILTFYCLDKACPHSVFQLKCSFGNKHIFHVFLQHRLVLPLHNLKRLLFICYYLVIVCIILRRNKNPKGRVILSLLGRAPDAHLQIEEEEVANQVSCLL